MSDVTVETTEETVEEPAAPDVTEDRPLGPEGEKALEAFKKRAREAEKEAKRAKELEAELAKLREDAMSDQEKAIEQARREAAEQARTETLAAANERLFREAVKATASGKIVDPDLLDDPLVAQRLLGFDDVPVTEDGYVDASAIEAAVSALLEAKPHLAVSATRQSGSADQGPQGRPKAGQLSREELASMTPEQIGKAMDEGRFDVLLGRR